MRALLAATLAFAAACGGDDDPPTGGQQQTPTITFAGSGATLSLVAGTSSTTTFNLTRGGGFTGDVAVTITGAPTGVTATLNPSTLNSSTTATTLTVATAATTAPGTYPLTVTATGAGVTTQTATLTLTVTAPAPTPAFTIAVPAGATIAAGASGTARVNVTRTAFTAGVNLTVEGAPAGVTATVAPNPTSADTAAITLAVASTVAPGTYTLTVRGASAGLTDRTTTFTLTVTAPTVTGNYTLTVTPTTLSIPQGGSGTATVNLARTGGFAGSVGLSTAGAPAGLTVTLASTSTTGNSVGVTIAASSTVAPGTYPINFTGTATGLTNQAATINVTVTAAATGSFTLAVAPTTVSLAQGATATAAVNLTRTGGFADAVGLAITGAPAGLTATLASASTTGNSVGINLSAGATLAPGTYNLTITGTAAGIANQTATLAVTVTAAPAGSFTISVSPATINLQRGGTATVTVDIARTGGFADPVDVTVTGLPAGVTATIAPATTVQLGVRGSALQGSRAASVRTARSVSTRSAALLVPIPSNRATITFTSTAAAPTGPFTPTITATAGGITRTATTTTVTVTPAPTGAISYQFCDATNIPIWVAVQDGTGAWTQVTGTSNLYRFDITSGRGGVAIVTPNGGGGFNTIVYYGTTAELTSYGASQCVSGAGGNKTLRGSVAGLAAASGPLSPGDQATVGTSGRSKTATAAAPTFTLDSVPDGARDYVAANAGQTFSGTGFTLAVSKLIVRRDQNYANGATIPTFDFNAAEAFAPVQRNVTVNNLGGDALTLGVTFTTANGASGAGSTTGSGVAIYQETVLSGGGSRSFYAVPAAQLRSTDIQLLTLGAITIGTSTVNVPVRTVTRAFGTPADQSVTFGPQLPIPTQTTLSGPYPRYRAQAAVQAEYSNIFLASWYQVLSSGAQSRAVSVYQTSGYTGGAAWDVSIPDFTGTAGFNPIWMLQGTGGTSTIFTAIGYDFPATNPNAVALGGTIRTGTRTTTVVPGLSVRASLSSPSALLSKESVFAKLSSLLLPKVFVRPERLTGRRW